MEIQRKSYRLFKFSMFYFVSKVMKTPMTSFANLKCLHEMSSKATRQVLVNSIYHRNYSLKSLNSCNYVEGVVNTLEVDEDTAVSIVKSFKKFGHDDLSRLEKMKNFFISVGVPLEELTKNAKTILSVHYNSEVEQKYYYLKEMGIENITTEKLMPSRFKSLVKMTVDQLHTSGELSSKVHSLDLLLSVVNGPPSLRNSIKNNYKTLRDEPLCYMHDIVLLEFLIWKLQSNKEEILYLFKQHETFQHLSFHSIMQVFKLLLEDIGFSIEKIKCNGFLLCTQATKVSNILKELPYVLDVKITDLVKKFPRILSAGIDHLKKNVELLKQHNITSKQIMVNGTILPLHPDTVSERLNILENIPEIKQMKTHSQYLKLVSSHKISLERLEYLKTNKIPVTIQLLYISQGRFEVHLSSPDDRFLRKEIIAFLANYLKVSKQVVSNKLHSHYINAEVNSVDNVMKVLQLLTNSNFSRDDILDNIFLILLKYETIKKELKSVENNTLDEIMNLKNSLLSTKRRKRMYNKRLSVQEQLTIAKLIFCERN